MFRRPPLPDFPPGGLLVGGAARDWLRGVTPRDFDWAVPDPAAAARQRAEGTGGAVFPLDAERGYWRVSAPGGVQHDFVPLPPDIADDLLRRDFTVNALALTAGREVIDPAGGGADLRAKRLRMVRPENLRADPLRAWRAARLSVTLGFSLAPATAHEVQQVAAALAAGTLAVPAAERVRDEVQTLLAHPLAAHGIQQLEDLGLLALTVPELRAGRSLTQGGFHHLDVYGHSLEALHQLIARQPHASLPLRWAALLHDIGKPPTAATDPDTGRRTFYGHDKVGAKLTYRILTRLKLPAGEIAHASRLVGAHMLPLPANAKEARRFVHRRRELLPDLLSVMLADREAARGPASTPASRYAYALGMERVLAALEEQPSAPAPLLTGQEIMELLGLEPGPGVGQAVRALAEAAATHEVSDAQGARAFLKAWARG
ncbi:HD domain-containing protein [Deinococcus sp.]|uniref:HD domain-containing protein n=1 Tax=Deinococcus sp. TaxID=47478 RepID=UPI0025BEF53C|nr:HD domain-containing protein [Deinococcus sp.]